MNPVIGPVDGAGSNAYSGEADVRMGMALGILDNLTDQFEAQPGRAVTVEPGGAIVQSLFAAIHMLRDARGLYDRALEPAAAKVTP